MVRPPRDRRGRPGAVGCGGDADDGPDDRRDDSPDESADAGAPTVAAPAAEPTTATPAPATEAVESLYGPGDFADSTDTATTTAPAGDGAMESGAGGTVMVVERDFQITLNPSTVAAGDVTFNVRNDDPDEHQFVVLRTDLPAGGLPLDERGFAVDESADGLALVGRIPAIAGGTAESVTIALESGRHVVICNVPGHYDLGMVTVLAVT